MRKISIFKIGVACLMAALTMAGGLIGLMSRAQASVIATTKPVAFVGQPGMNGYTMLDANGHIYTFGTNYFGDPSAYRVAPFVAMAYTPSGRGYAVVDSDGRVYNFGDSNYHGGGDSRTAPYVAIAFKPGGDSYTLMNSKGQIYNFGTSYLGAPDSRFSYTALAYTPSGNGYLAMSTTGQIYAFGDAQYYGGSPSGITPPMRGLAFGPLNDRGYIMIDAVGHVYNYGTLYYGGNTVASAKGFIGLVYSTSGKGYAMADEIGHVYNFGDSQYYGGIDAIQSSPAPTPKPTPTPVPSGFVQREVQLTKDEWTWWGGRKECSSADTISRVKSYYGTSSWYCLWVTENGVRHQEFNLPWSAAFISAMMQKAGAGTKFAYSTAHITYINQAIAATKNHDSSALFLYENPQSYAPQLGDLVCAQHSQYNHCMIVTSVQSGSISVMSGNESDTVLKETMSTGSDGVLTSSTRANNDIVWILRNNAAGAGIK